MGSSEPPSQQDGPHVVLHVFETTGGAARPTKTIRSNKDGLQVAVSARRSHKKSRAGCIRCKTRRVKCDESKPACVNCLRKGNACVYPNAHPSSPRMSDKPLKAETRIYQNTPKAFPTIVSDTFTMDDMRFFHHFLVKAKPHLPIGNDNVWSREIPQFAQQNPFLMHAILALGATHLSRQLDSDCYKIQSLTHRVKGLDGLRRAVAKDTWQYGDADSFIAAGYALMQQSAHLDDAMSEWISLLRLIFSISFKVNQNQNIITEFDIQPDRHGEHIVSHMHLLPSMDATLLSQGIDALDRLRHHLTDKLAIDFHQILKRCFKEHQISPQGGYLAFGGIFAFWIDLSTENLAKFLDPAQGECQLVLLYFVSIFLMMVPLASIENYQLVEYSSARHLSGIFGWAHRASLNVPSRLKVHACFPESVVARAAAEICGTPIPGPGVMQLDVAHDIALQMRNLALEKENSKHSTPAIAGL